MLECSSRLSWIKRSDWGIENRRSGRVQRSFAVCIICARGDCIDALDRRSRRMGKGTHSRPFLRPCVNGGADVPRCHREPTRNCTRTLRGSREGVVFTLDVPAKCAVRSGAMGAPRATNCRAETTNTRQDLPGPEPRLLLPRGTVSIAAAKLQSCRPAVGHGRRSEDEN